MSERSVISNNKKAEQSASLSKISGSEAEAVSQEKKKSLIKLGIISFLLLVVLIFATI